MMIALHGVPGGTKAERSRVSLIVEGEEYLLIIGDSHGAWRSHQTAVTTESFETLFRRLADRPNARIGVDGVRILTD